MSVMATVSALSISDQEATVGRAFAVVMASRNGANDASFTVWLSSAASLTGIWLHLAISSCAYSLVMNFMNFHAPSLLAVLNMAMSSPPSTEIEPAEPAGTSLVP